MDYTERQIDNARMDLQIAAEHLVDAKIMHARGNHDLGIHTSRSTQPRLAHAKRILGITLADVYEAMDREFEERCRYFPAVAALFERETR